MYIHAGHGRVFWISDKEPDEFWKADYLGHAVIQGVEYRIEGYRAYSESGKYVRFAFKMKLKEGDYSDGESKCNK